MVAPDKDLVDMLYAGGRYHTQTQAGQGPALASSGQGLREKLAPLGRFDIQPVEAPRGAGHQGGFHCTLSYSIEAAVIQPTDHHLVVGSHGADQSRPTAVARSQKGVDQRQTDAAVVNGVEQQRIAPSADQIHSQMMALAVQETGERMSRAADRQRLRLLAPQYDPLRLPVAAVEVILDTGEIVLIQGNRRLPATGGALVIAPLGSRRSGRLLRGCSPGMLVLVSAA